ncbi:hypothetical protein BT69DRAFT_1321975, partial [Atractiella rhizophila]
NIAQKRILLLEKDKNIPPKNFAAFLAKTGKGLQGGGKESVGVEKRSKLSHELKNYWAAPGELVTKCGKRNREDVDAEDGERRVKAREQ